MSWTLAVVQGAELADGLRRECRLPEPLQRWVIGRDPACDWLFADRTKALSARHCEIVASPHGPLLRDLSTNGSFVNGAGVRMAHDHVLRDGDRIEIGPYVITVAGPPMPPRPAGEKALTQMAPARPVAVTDTAPVARGGDPAAMLAAGGAEALRLTEILRVARPREDSGVELTKIRVAAPAPSASARPAKPLPAPPPPAPPVPPTPVPRQAFEPDLLLPTVAQPPTSLEQALSRGLGVPPSALHGQDLLLITEQLAAVAATAAAALRGSGPAPLLALALRPGAAVAEIEQALRALKGGGAAR